MNNNIRNTVDEMIEVLQAHRQGKQLQFWSPIENEYRDVIGTPVFNFDSDRYRVKPELKEIFRLSPGVGSSVVYYYESRHKFDRHWPNKASLKDSIAQWGYSLTRYVEDSSYRL